MSTETSPSVSMIIPLQKMILKSMTSSAEDSTTIKEAKAAITKDLKGRYNDPGVQDYLHRATALDPRFKSLPYLEEVCIQKIYDDLTTDILDIEKQVIFCVCVCVCVLSNLNLIYFIYIYIFFFYPNDNCNLIFY